MPRFAANLSMLWPELDVYDRFQAAADAGFKRVEILFVHVLDLIGTSFGGSTMMTRNLPRFMSRDFSPATPVGLILKDLGLIHDEARNGGIPLLLGALAEQRFSEARARGMGDEDMAALVKLWEEPAGVTVDRAS